MTVFETSFVVPKPCEILEEKTNSDKVVICEFRKYCKCRVFKVHKKNGYKKVYDEQFLLFPQCFHPFGLFSAIFIS